MTTGELDTIRAALLAGAVIPYLGPSVLALDARNEVVPTSPDALVKRLTAKASVPHKIRNNLSATAQFIENFKHRKTVVNLMTEAFSAPVQPTELHRYLAGLTQLPMIVDTWYDNAMELALKAHGNAPGRASAAAGGMPGAAAWGQIQGLSQSEHFGYWTQAYCADGTKAADAEVTAWASLLYKPHGSITPAANFLVSDTDYVEVITEIDIQTPIPTSVQQRRSGRSFLFLGCRFANQLERTFARQIIKRSSAKHWAVLPTPPTKNEQRFLAEQNIQRIDARLADFVAMLTETQASDLRRQASSNSQATPCNTLMV